MIQSFFNGFGTGFVLSLMLGTVFFALIQHSIDNGYKSGILIASGVILSDLLFISVAISGTAMVPELKSHDSTIRIIGAVLLFLFGLLSIIRDNPAIVYPKTRMGNVIFYLSKGIFLNLLNPVNFFSWLAISAYLTGVMHYTVSQNVTFFTGCLLAIFLTEVGISVAAFNLKRFFNENVLYWINKVAGIAFILFSIILIIPVFRNPNF